MFFFCFCGCFFLLTDWRNVRIANKQIVIQTMSSGRRLFFNVLLHTDTVTSVKATLESHIHIVRQCQLLYYQGQVLQDYYYHPPQQPQASWSNQSQPSQQQWESVPSSRSTPNDDDHDHELSPYLQEDQDCGVATLADWDIREGSVLYLTIRTLGG